jgi:hypothetical protein
LAVSTAACLSADLSPRPALVATAPAPSRDERYCAWYGDRSGELLYFGESGFWSALRRSGGRPTADLDRAGPAWIGRFDLAAERLLPPIDVTSSDDRSGVWDVVAHPNGRLYFTTFFGFAGSVDPDTGIVQRFPGAGRGLNEIALGPGENLLASRYGAGDGSQTGGGVVVMDPDGRIIAEFPLTPPAGFDAAAKTVAYDRLRDEIWVTTDLLPRAESDDPTIRHDAYRLDGRGAEIERIASPEVQFVAYAADATGYRAEREGEMLWLSIVPPGEQNPSDATLRIPLARDFPAEFDFVQDIQFATDGSAVVSRWSGWVHVVDANGAVRSLRLPPVDPRGLYYSATLRGERVCATHCGDVTVVCQDLDSGR